MIGAAGDDPAVIVGSTNWKEAGAYDNDESLVGRRPRPMWSNGCAKQQPSEMSGRAGSGVGGRSLPARYTSRSSSSLPISGMSPCSRLRSLQGDLQHPNSLDASLME